MRVLVITRAPWRDDNNTGNTLSNFFGNMNEVEFYNLYFRDQKPMNNISIEDFSISESQLIKNFFNKTNVGKVVLNEDTTSDFEEKLYLNAKKHNNSLLMFLRDAVWTICNWRSENLKDFLNKTNPDIVFMPVFNCFYPHKVLRFVKEQTNARVVLFHADDNYTLKQFSLSPLYWIYRFNLRRWVRNSVEISDVNYAISNLQKNEYEKVFNKHFKVLTKGIDFSVEPIFKEEYNSPLQLIYTGNIVTNRWKSLLHIANVLEKININGVKAQLRIYTGNTLTDNMNNALNKGDSSFVMGSVSADKIKEIQLNADMLVHVEALDLKNKLVVRQSFSTKIIDYMATARPILAYGPKDVASIDYFVKNGCAIVSDNEEDLYSSLLNIISNNNLLHALSRKAFLYAKEHHSNAYIDKMLKDDFESLINY